MSHKGRGKQLWAQTKSLLEANGHPIEVTLPPKVTHKPRQLPNRSTKSSDISIDKAETSKFWEKFQMQYGFGKKPVSDDFLNDLAKQLVEWCQREDALTINKFCEMIGIARSTYDSWTKRETKLKQAHEFAKMCISNRMMEGAIYLNKGMRENAVSHLLPLYSDEYREASHLRASLRAQDNTGEKQNITVEMNQFPGSNLVPEKKDL